MTALTIAEQASLTAGASMWRTVAIPGADIPSLHLSDGPMGIASGRVDERDVARLSPCATALGASFELSLIERMGALVGGEAVRCGVDMVLAPNVNLARSPLAGRAFEYYSEDPLLTGLAGAAWTRGLQSTGTGACVKHLVCNDSETDRDRMNAVVGERALREIYLLPFELCAAAGAGAMLTAYNRVNGTWCAEHGHISTIVKREWGFDGPFISDWFGTHSTAGSLNGGLDLEMPGPARFVGAKAVNAVEGGEVPGDRLADAADRVARAGRRWSGVKTPPTEDADALLVEAAAAGMVLLRNEGELLPLVPGRHARIAVIGPNAAAPCYQGGTFAKIALSPDALRPLDALRARYGDDAIVYEPGVDPQPRLPSMPVASLYGEGRGMTVEYFADTDLTGDPIFRELRDTNSLVWFVGVHDDGVFDRPAGVRASGWFTAAAEGAHRFYVGATGAVRMRVDGRVVHDHAERMAASDVMGSLKRGDADSVEVHLTAGQRVLVEVEFIYDGARVHGLWYGVRGPDSAAAMLARAVEAAGQADAVILMVGETSDSSVESKDRADTTLAADQVALIEAVCAANSNVAIVANIGHAFDARWGDRAAALLSAWYPGEGFGPALAAVLSGDVEPGGRLPVTLARSEAQYPALSLQPDAAGDLRYDDDVLVGYRGLVARGHTPLYAFGAGRGYTRFEWIDAVADGGDVLVTLRNTGARSGSEVVQLYRHDPEFALVGFAKVTLAAGEMAVVRVTPEPRLFRIWQGDGWRNRPATAHIAAGPASDRLPFTVEIAL
ncbi:MULTISPECIES: glycoside hydrolase family 3 protein [unclassified Sphingomonas]|uniref:glycoside hydrolase family 3 protein n=1 Tax=unclassified Sphingomonas TaxID=196159 RepID=UPI0006FB911A|nr:MULTISPECIES: glycoside hydrolase family 3 C-terminal domain-containing protein [unclassified Sphingomonas]KQM66246.1 beta-glucosidase [Sphingomonas sp. Leaf16]KQN08702.1 beta-glucosidase [Sphingomonas sp. Leaf29]KQN17282.1 beta-glucosidase [Sphingomonas sp. Leaf32]